jgi:hypothetical protein
MELAGKYTLYPDPDFDRIGAERRGSDGSVAHREHPGLENPGKMAGVRGGLEPGVVWMGRDILD